MCGIIAVFGLADSSIRVRNRLLDLSKRLRHRGPDWSGIHQEKKCVRAPTRRAAASRSRPPAPGGTPSPTCARRPRADRPARDPPCSNFLMHERLAIMDPTSGDQPLYNEDKTVIVTVNGEIYNHLALKREIQARRARKFGSESDCEVIAHMYEDLGEGFVSQLDGMFAFVVYDKRDGSFIAARDPIGITTMYMGYGRDGSVWFASEMKALKDECERFEVFKPGHIFSSKTMEFSRWYNPQWLTDFEKVPPVVPPPAEIDLGVLRGKFEKAVVKRMMSDVPFGVLLSGGLDSSLVASICSRHMVRLSAAPRPVAAVRPRPRRG